jgi:para-nitrobenzyl esterase
MVAGERVSGTACAWKGIPFASSGPAYRFRRPGPAPSFTGVRAATKFGAACLSPVFNFLAPGGVDEDCLNLNIWRDDARAASASKPKPVMVFLYGGAFILGSGSWMVYDGASLAKNDVIVVTINYRLGPLGFFGSPAQRAQDPAGAAGNWGIWDQIAALEWVRGNIQNFGGDPKNVTVFGESAGGFSVCTLLASPAAAGLFQSAIMESGGCLVHSLEQQFEGSKALVARTPCAGAKDEMECLRHLDADDLNLWQRMWSGAGPTVDGVLLKEQPLEALRNGHGQPVPLLIGSNRDELRPLTLIPTIAWNVDQPRESYWQNVAATRGDAEARTLRALYPARKGATTRELWVDMADDIFFRCTVAWASEAQSKVAPVFAYEFDIGERDTWSAKQMGAYHSIEIPYLFGFLGWPRVMNAMNGGFGTEERSADYSRRLQSYWASFARTGNPNAAGSRPWPAYADGQKIVRLQPDRNTVLAGAGQKQCAYWNTKGLATFPQQAALLSEMSRSAGIPLGAAFDVK